MKRSIIEAHFYVDGKPMVFIKWVEHAEHGKCEKTLRMPINNIALMANKELIEFVEKLIVQHENNDVQNNVQQKKNMIFLRYAEELTALSKRDIEPAVLMDLINTGVECLPEVIQLNQLNDKKLAEYNKLFRKKCTLENMERVKLFADIL